jgi:hypothetical protein
VLVLYSISILGIVFVSCFFVSLCRDPGCRKSIDVWYIRGLMREKRYARRAAAHFRRVA